MKKMILSFLLLSISLVAFSQRSISLKLNQQLQANITHSAYFSTGIGINAQLSKRLTLGVAYNLGFLRNKGLSHVFDLESRFFFGKVFVAPHLTRSIYKETIGDNYYKEDGITGFGLKIGYTKTINDKFLITPFLGAALASKPFPQKPFYLRALLGVETAILLK